MLITIPVISYFLNVATTTVMPDSTILTDRPTLQEA